MFPPYAFVPGLFPHPESDPLGHHHTHPIAVPNERRFDRAVLLFDAGYYWEAHEMWESLWHEYPRQASEALFLKGLIRLAACGVKHREHRADGITDHAAGAARLFRQSGQDFRGLTIERLLAACEQAAQVPITFPEHEPPVRVVFGFVLGTVPQGPLSA
jgi:predicted metal-dependent hydrolase